MIDAPSTRRAAGRSDALVVLEPLPPEVAALAPMDAAEAFRDLSGLALLESARPGRRSDWTYLCADPIALLDAPSEGRDPFIASRRLLCRLAGDSDTGGLSGPPFIGGLVGYLAYDLGMVFEPRTTLASDDQGLPTL